MPPEHITQKSKDSEHHRLSCQDSLSTVSLLQLFLDDSKMKNFVTCFKGIAYCAAPSCLSLPFRASVPQL